MTRVLSPAHLHLAAAAGLSVLLSSCASFSPDGGVTVAAQAARHQFGMDVVALRSDEESDWAKSRMAQLLASVP